MKTNKLLTLVLAFISILFINSCVEDDDYSTPDLTVQPIDVAALGQQTTFEAVVDRYQTAIADGDQVGTFSVEDENPLYIVGYVVSDDSQGNFYEEILIQNTPNADDLGTNDPRRGFKVELNERDLSGYYNFGRKVYIKLNGLAIGLENGVYTLGRANGNSLGQIEFFEYLDFIIRDPEVATITPKTVNSIADFTENDENTLVQVNDVQFNRHVVNSTYAGEETDEFDGFRVLESCADNLTIELQTSTFADFKSEILSGLRGNIQAIFTRDFNDDKNVLVVNSLADINFTDTNRCDPVELDCGTASSQGATNLFYDDFETQQPFSLVTGNGWTNYIEAGTEGFEAYTSGGSNASLGVSARVGSFQSGDASSVAWLITPAIDLDAQDNETFSFDSSNSFSDGSELELLFSNDWDGTTAGIATATWGVIPAAYIVQDSDFFGDWLSSGIVDLSCGTGTIHIAFKYTGSGDSGFDGTFELDNISIDYTP